MCDRMMLISFQSMGNDRRAIQIHTLPITVVGGTTRPFVESILFNGWEIIGVKKPTSFLLSGFEFCGREMIGVKYKFTLYP
jgi:hypothetical protein